MADVLKVLMMGGQRAGKTSVLAGLLATMTNGPVKDVVEVNNTTTSSEASQKLTKSIETLKWHLLTSMDKTFLIDDGKTFAFDDYTLQFSIPNTDSRMDIVFTDANGEFFDMGRLHDTDIREKVREYDVFVVAIDTPFLMEAVNPGNKFCTEAINNSYNHINDIYTFLTELDDKDGADAKLVVFAPLKCEKWVKEGRVDEVVSRVKQVYSTTIHALSKYRNIEIDIMPIQTVGNIVFSEQTKALTCMVDETVRPCAVINNKKQVRFGNGDVEDLDLSRHRIQEDGSAVIREGSSLMKPNSWFTTVGKEYQPHNCDQLAYYILQFYLAKVMFAKKVEELEQNKKRWKWRKWLAVVLSYGMGGLLGFNWLIAAVIAYFSSKYLEKKFGTITLEEMLALTKKLQMGGYIKKNTDGIETIKESKLYVFK